MRHFGTYLAALIALSAAAAASPAFRMTTPVPTPDGNSLRISGFVCRSFPLFAPVPANVRVVSRNGSGSTVLGNPVPLETNGLAARAPSCAPYSLRVAGANATGICVQALSQSGAVVETACIAD